jgi:drug/metabolite transporter (DMT)-like permease
LILVLWIPVTLAGAAAQVVRNGLQASLTTSLGALGAAYVRFLFGLPFAVVLWLATLWVSGSASPDMTAIAWRWSFIGAVAQIAATALMLVVMQRRAFGVAYAYIKTEPVVVAILGAVVLRDMLPAAAWGAIALVTAGVVLTAVRPSDFGKLVGEGWTAAGGILAGALFGLSAIAFRGSIEALGDAHFVLRALTILVVSLTIQTALLGAWLALRQPTTFITTLLHWRVSLAAGFIGALSSACWFIAFSLTAAANVRTLALVEMPLAAALSGRLSGRTMAAHELAGLGLVALGVALLLASAIT